MLRISFAAYLMEPVGKELLHAGFGDAGHGGGHRGRYSQDDRLLFLMVDEPVERCPCLANTFQPHDRDRGIIRSRFPPPGTQLFINTRAPDLFGFVSPSRVLAKHGVRVFG